MFDAIQFDLMGRGGGAVQRKNMQMQNVVASFLLIGALPLFRLGRLSCLYREAIISVLKAEAEEIFRLFWVLTPKYSDLRNQNIIY